MTYEIFFILILLAATLIVFALDLLPIEVTAMGLLAVLVVSGLIDIDRALSGLNNKAMVTIAGLFVLSHSLVRTGLLEIGADFLSRKVGKRSWLGIGIFLAIAGVVSGFLNNTAVVAIFIPLALTLCERFQINPSKVLIPLSYVAIVGGTVTLIGTSTNLLVSSIVEDAGHRPLGMFEFTPLGAIFLFLGLGYVLIFARLLLPSRAGTQSLTRKYGMGAYLTELIVQPDSPLIGKSCHEAQLRELYEVTAVAVVRGDRPVAGEVGAVKLKPEDVLIVEGSLKDLLRLRKEQEVALLPDVKMDDQELADHGQTLAEALIPPNSRLIGKTLARINFRQRYGAFVLAIRRRGATLRDKVARIPLKSADTLLLAASESKLEELRNSEALLILSRLELKLKDLKLWWLPLVIVPAVVALAGLGVLSILEGALLGALILLLTGNLRPREAYRAIDWSVVFLIAAFVPVGEAMIKTGAAQFLADQLTVLTSYAARDWQPHLALALTYLITSLMTQMVSNNAAAIIMTPVILSLAASLGVDARPYVIAICFAASSEFMTPVGYQTNMMVYGPGSYRFLDYTRFGFPLNLSFWLIASLFIPWFWPL